MITLSEEGCRKNGTTVGEVLVLFAIHDQEDLGRIQENLVNKGYITSYGDIKFPLKWRITNAGKDLINSVLAPLVLKIVFNSVSSLALFSINF